MCLIIWDFYELTLIEEKSDRGGDCTDDWVVTRSLGNSSESRMAETAGSHSLKVLLQPSHLCSAGPSHSQLSIYPIYNS